MNEKPQKQIMQLLKKDRERQKKFFESVLAELSFPKGMEAISIWPEVPDQGLMETLPKKHVVYFIRFERSLEEVEVERLIGRVKRLKERKYPKLPKVNALDSVSRQVLYIGKSSTNFQGRVKDHLGVKSETTYALHLTRWFEDLKLEVGLKLYYLDLGKVLSTDQQEQKDDLEKIESAFHAAFKPILGRTGH